jgi:hypothetical protein
METDLGARNGGAEMSDLFAMLSQYHRGDRLATERGWFGKEVDQHGNLALAHTVCHQPERMLHQLRRVEELKCLGPLP